MAPTTAFAPSDNHPMPLAERVEPAPLTAAELLAEVSRLYQALKTAPADHRPALERQIRAYAERYWAFETAAGDPIVGKLGGRRRPYLVLGIQRSRASDHMA
jgi:hypothetical protein